MHVNFTELLLLNTKVFCMGPIDLVESYIMQPAHSWNDKTLSEYFIRYLLDLFFRLLVFCCHLST